MLYNCQSLLSFVRRRKLCNYLSIHQPTLVCITESWLTSDVHSSELLPTATYSILSRSDRQVGQHGGVFIACHSSCPFPVIDITDHMFDFSCACVVLSADQSCLILLVYSPPRSSAYCLDASSIVHCVESMYHRFTMICESHNIPSQARAVVVLGDFNLPDICWHTLSASCGHSESLLHFFDSYNLQQVIETPTHAAGNILDLVLSSPGAVVNSYVDQASVISDHLPIHAEISLRSNSCLKHGQIPVYSKCSFRENMFWEHSAFLSDYVAWNAPLNICYDTWYQLLQYPTNLSLTVKRIRRQLLPYYYSSHTVHLLNRKSTVQRRLIKNWNLRDACLLRTLGAEADQSIVMDESVLFMSLNHTQACFKFLRTMRKTTLPSTINWNSLVACSDSERANLFNLYFSSVFSEVSDHIPIPFNSDPTTRLVDISISIDIVERMLASVDDSCSFAYDRIPPFILRSQARLLATPVFFLFLSVLHSGTWPHMWKTSVVTPILKKGNAMHASNYRPISILPKLSLILERLIFNFIYPKVRHQINRNQHGFMSRRSTATQLVCFLDKLYWANERNEPFHVVYFDIQKAFDTVPHSLLISKLSRYGFDYMFLALFSSYLENRRQVVRVNQTLSNPCYVPSGVPQGSVIGPLLFVLFINDLPGCLTSSTCYLFADDSKILNNDVDQLQLDIDSMVTWSQANGLRFHPDKTRLISSRESNPAVTIGNAPICNAATVCDLGVTISSNLTWIIHVRNKLAKGMAMLYLMRGAISYHANARTKTQLIESTVYPVVMYCSPAWRPNITSLRKLMKFQHRCLKWSTGCPDFKFALLSQRQLPFCYQLIYNDAVFLWKILNDKTDIDALEYVSYSDVDRAARGSTRRPFLVSRHGKARTEDNFFTRATTLANDLHSISIDINCPLKSFKSSLFKYLLYRTTTLNMCSSCSFFVKCRCSSCRV